MASNSHLTTRDSKTTRPTPFRNEIGFMRPSHGTENGLCHSSKATSYRHWQPARNATNVDTDKANEQHYEVCAGFFEKCLGPRLKYSCCLYPTGNETLEEAETEMLESYVGKAGLVDGLHILDLGCGWGSLSLFLAEVDPLRDVNVEISQVEDHEFIE